MTDEVTPEGSPAPRRRKARTTFSEVASKHSKSVIVTLVLGLATVYFQYRTETAKDRADDAKNTAKAVDIKTDKGYETLAPLVADLQQQVKTLAIQVELLKEFAMAQKPRASLGSRPTRPQVEAAAAVEATIEKIEGAPDLPNRAAVAAPPATLDD